MGFNWLKEATKILSGAFSVSAEVQKSIDHAANPLAPAKVAPGVKPKELLAFDAYVGDCSTLKSAYSLFSGLPALEGMCHFIGFPALAALEQNGTLNAIISKLIEEMFRKWIEFKGENADQVRLIEDEFKRLGIREHFEWAARIALFQGGCLLYMDAGADFNDPIEMATPLRFDKYKVGLNSVRGLRRIEPYMCSPAQYDVSNPLNPHYFKPTHWYVNGMKVHASRFLHFTNNDLPFFLKPSYNFFGISMAQMMLPYLHNFEKARDAASELAYNFSLLYFKTDLSSLLTPSMNQGQIQAGITTLKNRVKMFLASRKNNGLAVVDKENEDFFQLNTPLSGIEGLVSQQLELITLIPSIPITRLFGQPPQGFNATGESDEKNFYDRVMALNMRLCDPNLRKVEMLVELSVLGEITDDVEIEWIPLKDPDPNQIADINLKNAQRDITYLQNGTLDKYEVRKNLSENVNSDYAQIEVGPADINNASEAANATEGEALQAIIRQTFGKMGVPYGGTASAGNAQLNN